MVWFCKCGKRYVRLYNKHPRYRVDGGPFSNPYALDPGSTIGYVAYGGIPGIKYSLNGNIANTDFTVGGVTYAATVLNWTTPTWVIDFNGVLPIDVSATPIATPEPNSATLILTVVGLFALMILMRKRIGRGESRIEWKCSR
jgi:hypothetical protein